MKAEPNALLSQIPRCGTSVATADPILTVSEVALELRCSKAHVYHLIDGLVAGVPPLPAIRMGRRRVVRRSTLEKWKRDAEMVLCSVNVETSPNIDTVGASRSNR
jgi:excisionase family DNA binding protein